MQMRLLPGSSRRMIPINGLLEIQMAIVRLAWLTGSGKVLAGNLQFAHTRDNCTLYS